MVSTSMLLLHQGPSTQLNASPLHHVIRFPSSSSSHHNRGVMMIMMMKPSCNNDKNKNNVKRRDFLQLLSVGTAISTTFDHNVHWIYGRDEDDCAIAAGLPQEEPLKLCDDSCEKDLENIPTVTTESGLQYKDIKVGSGPSPPVGYQVAANYVAMVPSGKVFDSSLEKGTPYIFRVGSGQVVKGLDEGILSMKVGGKRRIYVPGQLAFPKGLPAAAGRPRVLPNSPVIFDVSLEYVPGLDDVEE